MSQSDDEVKPTFEIPDNRKKTNQEKLKQSQADPVAVEVVIPTTKHHYGKQYDKDKIKEIFLASPHVEWAPFAESLGMDPIRSRQEFPYKKWIKEKKNLIARTQAEKLSDQLFDFEGKWYKQALTALTDYPKSAEAIHNLAKYRISQILEIANHDREEAKTQKNPMNRAFMAKEIREEIESMARVVKLAQETNYKALMLDGWSLEATKRALDETIHLPEQDDQEQARGDLVIKIKGQDSWSGKEWTEFMDEYLDKPQITHTETKE